MAELISFEVRRNAVRNCWDVYILNGWVTLPYTLGASFDEVEAALQKRAELKGDAAPCRIIHATYADVRS